MKKSLLLITIFFGQAGFPQGRTISSQKPSVAPGYQPVSVEQLEQILAAEKRHSDQKVAARIDSLGLKERLSGAVLLRCEKLVRGIRAKEALLLLADQSIFLPPPAAEIPPLAEPDAASRNAIIALTEDYVTNTLHRLPDFYATRVTTTFRRNVFTDASLHSVGTIATMVYYRSGKEVIRSESGPSENPGLISRGVFGPILAMAMLDSVKGNIAFSHWERGAAGLQAVFSYSVNAADSHYEVDGQELAYRCEFAVDPTSGAIWRLILRTGIDPAAKIADLAVEYGPVELGGTIYICPIKSVVLSRAIEITWLNDVVFKQYHLLHEDWRMLPGFTQVP